MTDEGKAAVTFGGELRARDEKTLKTVKLDCIKYINTARKELDSFLQNFNQIDNPEEENDHPSAYRSHRYFVEKVQEHDSDRDRHGQGVAETGEVARKECDEPSTRSLKAFANADEAIKGLLLVIGRT